MELAHSAETPGGVHVFTVTGGKRDGGATSTQSCCGRIRTACVKQARSFLRSTACQTGAPSRITVPFSVWRKHHLMTRSGDGHSSPRRTVAHLEVIVQAQRASAEQCVPVRNDTCDGVCAAHTGVQLAAGQVVVSLFSLLPAVTWPHACFGAAQYLVASLLTSQSSALGDKLLGGVAYVGLTWWSAALGGAVVRCCASAHTTGQGASLGTLARRLPGLTCC